MKFRKNSTHEFCVTIALGLWADCFHKVTHFGFVRFQCIRKLTPFEIFPCRLQPAVQIFVLFQPFTSDPFKIIL